MKPFIRKKGVAAFIEGRNIDTDQIIPGRYLKSNRDEGYGGFLFHDLRFDVDGQQDPDFVLNRRPFQFAEILVTQENFGCGSSREGAVYALADYGVRALIGPSFGDIFFNNCLKNGIVPVKIPNPLAERLAELIHQKPGCSVEVDLTAMHVIFPDGMAHSFEIDPFWRECLMKGVDDLQLTLGYQARIESFIESYYRRNPWTLPAE